MFKTLFIKKKTKNEKQKQPKNKYQHKYTFSLLGMSYHWKLKAWLGYDKSCDSARLLHDVGPQNYDILTCEGGRRDTSSHTSPQIWDVATIKQPNVC